MNKYGIVIRVSIKTGIGGITLFLKINEEIDSLNESLRNFAMVSK